MVFFKFKIIKLNQLNFKMSYLTPVKPLDKKPVIIVLNKSVDCPSPICDGWLKIFGREDDGTPTGVECSMKRNADQSMQCELIICFGKFETSKCSSCLAVLSKVINDFIFNAKITYVSSLEIINLQISRQMGVCEMLFK